VAAEAGADDAAVLGDGLPLEVADGLGPAVGDSEAVVTDGVGEGLAGGELGGGELGGGELGGGELGGGELGDVECDGVELDEDAGVVAGDDGDDPVVVPVDVFAACVAAATRDVVKDGDVAVT
jgi:hypothetical protein